MSFRRSKRSIKARKFYTAGNRADGRWEDSVDEASATAMSIRREGSMQRHIQWQAILQKEVDDDSDATVVMKDDDDEDTYPRKDEVHEESNASEMTEDNAKQSTYSTSGDEPDVKRSKLGKDREKCNTVRTEDEIYIKWTFQAWN
jgi:hypothetical protein